MNTNKVRITCRSTTRGEYDYYYYHNERLLICAGFVEKYLKWPVATFLPQNVEVVFTNYKPHRGMAVRLQNYRNQIWWAYKKDKRHPWRHIFPLLQEIVKPLVPEIEETVVYVQIVPINS